ncbi:hypothetical protein OGCDGJMD_01469 [Cyanobium usitatum str. Tous]|jgi:hypothetical protein|uniref:hypothetical protein n=1 Tax=Cyanobium usitatum TaxID=2304190 RepID=UPI002AD22653|nr:hypothetical protein [Cyanobium usitatum]CAK6693623.1 hypothetical protein OGCDGJMD_01469 [Cyanobium usitatum str. Tous]
MNPDRKRGWLVAAALVGALFTVQSCNTENMKRAYLGVRECIGYEPGATLDDATELEAWRRCWTEEGWERWREVQRSYGDGGGSDP